MSIDTNSIMAEIRQNQDRVRGCAVHRFPAIGDTYRLGQKLTCLNCGGVMDLREVGNYLRGFAAAGGDPQIVLPDWKEPPTAAEDTRRVLQCPEKRPRPVTVEEIIAALPTMNGAWHAEAAALIRRLAQPVGEVDEAMIRRAWEAGCAKSAELGHESLGEPDEYDIECLRAALTAAWMPAGAGGVEDTKRLDWLLARVSVESRGLGRPSVSMPLGTSVAIDPNLSREAIDTAIGAGEGR